MMSTTNDGAVIIKADKERYLKIGIRQIRLLESEKGLNKSMGQIFTKDISFNDLFVIFKIALLGCSDKKDNEIEDIMDAAVSNLENGFTDLMDLIIKSGGGYFDTPKEDEETEVDGELQQLP